jgi:hypothetical protein
MRATVAAAVLGLLVVFAVKGGWHGFLFALAGVVICVVLVSAGEPARQRKREEGKRRRVEEAAAEERRQNLAYVQSSLAEIDAMPGVGFEHYVAAKLRTAGWEVTTTPATNDYGVDLIAKDGNEMWAIQCKRKSTPVGVSAVQQVVAGAIHYGCWRKMVVSNREFTRQAKVLALAHNCDLVGRALLPNWRLESRVSQEREAAPVLVRDDARETARSGIKKAVRCYKCKHVQSVPSRATKFNCGNCNTRLERVKKS